MLYLTPLQMPGVLKDIAKAGLVANILGSPGIGKTQIVNQFAKENSFHTIVYSLSQREPVDLQGYPGINQKTKRMEFFPDETLPLDGDDCPGKAFVLFLDEMNACTRLTAAAAYRLINERKSGTRSLHPRTIIIAAGNLRSDKAITTDVGTAMQSRLVNIMLQVDDKDWVSWANKHGIDTRVISFIKFKPDLLHKFSPDHDELNFPCPRTWEFVSRYITNKPKLSHVDLVVISGIVGNGASTTFKAFCNIFNELATIEEIKANPTSYKMRDEPSHYFAICTLVSRNLESDPSSLILAIQRIPKELQVVCLREAIERVPSIVDLPAVEDWVSNNAESFY